MCIYTYIVCLCINLHTHPYHLYSLIEQLFKMDIIVTWLFCTHIYVYTHTCLCAYIRTYTYIYIHVYTSCKASLRSCWRGLRSSSLTSFFIMSTRSAPVFFSFHCVYTLSACLYVMTSSYVWHDSFIGVTRLLSFYASYDSFMCLRCVWNRCDILLHECDKIPSLLLFFFSSFLHIPS